MRMRAFATLLLFFALVSFCEDKATAWGPITHMAILDDIMRNPQLNSDVKKILEENLKHAKGGALGPDMYNYFVGAGRYANIAHYCCAGDLAKKMLEMARKDADPRKIAFAYGWMIHVASDPIGHAWVNSLAGGEYDPENSIIKSAHRHIEMSIDKKNLMVHGKPLPDPESGMTYYTYDTDFDSPDLFNFSVFSNFFECRDNAPTTDIGQLAENISQLVYNALPKVIAGKDEKQYSTAEYQNAYQSSLLAAIDALNSSGGSLENWDLDTGETPTHSNCKDYEKCREFGKLKDCSPVPKSRPGGGSPDDTVSVSDFSNSNGTEALESLYRLAPKKGKKWMLWLRTVQDANTEYNGLAADAPIELVKEKLDKISALVSQLNDPLNGREFSANNPQLFGEIEETPDIAVLENGYFEEMVSLINRNQEPVRTIELDFYPPIAGNQPVLVIPSGGLYGLEKSEMFKASLDEYVKQGGTLIVFSQQHGYEYSALPVPQEADGSYNTIGGYGWEGDQNCFTNAAYIDTWHQILAGQSRTTATLNIDGFFSNYPSNSTILLRRTANGQPALLMYEYGQGRVIVTSMYSDFASKQNQASSEEITLIRDLVSWAKKPDQLPEIKPGESVSMPASVTNTTSTDASLVKLLIYNPNRATLLSEETVSLLIPAGQSATIPVTYATTQTSALGIYHIDYTLLDGQGNIIQPQAETDSGRFVVSNPPKPWIETRQITFSVQSDSAEYLIGSPVTLTIIGFNNSDVERTITAKYEGRSQIMVIPPQGQASFIYTKTAINEHDHYGQYWGRGWFYFYEEAKPLDSQLKWYRVYQPIAGVTVKGDKTQYAKGETVRISASLKNGAPLSWQGNAKIVIYDNNPENYSYKSIFEETKTVNLSASGTVSVLFDYTIPGDLPVGTYPIAIQTLGNGTNVAASAWTYFILPQSQVSVAPGLPSVYNVGTNTIPFTISNTGIINVNSGALNLSLKAPDGSTVYSGSQLFSVAVGETKTLAVPISIPSLRLGFYTLTYSQSDEARTGYPTTIYLPNSYSLNPSLDKPSYKIGESANLTISLTNTGKFAQEGSLTVDASFFGFSETRPVTINPSATESIPYNFPLPLTLTQGGPVQLTLAFPSGDRIGKGIYLAIKPAGIKQDIVFDKSLYRIGENLGINYIITNDGNFATPLNVSFNLSIPDLNYTYGGSLVLDPAQTKEIPLVIPLPETLLPGLHKVSVALALPWEPSLTKETGFVVPESSLRLDYLGTTTPMAGETISLSIENAGGVDTTYTTQKLSINDSHGVEIYGGSVTGSILTGEKKPLVDIQIPAQVLNGLAYLNVQLKDSKTGKTVYYDKPIEVRGLTASLQTRTDKDAYLITEAITGLSSMTNGSYGIEEGGLKVSVNKISQTTTGQFTQFLPKEQRVTFSFPGSVAVASDGSVYVADSDNHRVQKFDSNGVFITTWGSYCNIDSDGDGIADQSCNGQLNYPYSIAIGSDSFVYVADSENHRIQKFDSNGVFVTKWGSYCQVDTNWDGIPDQPCGDGQFSYPAAVAVGGDGSVYVADGNHRIQKFDSNGVFIAKWGSYCQADTDWDGMPDQTCNDGQFSYPAAIAVGGDGSVYVADGNHRIQKFDSNGVFITTWGSYCNVDSDGDGIGDQSCDGQFNYPSGIAIGADGSAYVLDSWNARIQKFDSNGTFFTKWGSYCNIDSDWNGIPDQSCEGGQFANPYGIAISPDGSVYVADSQNNRIQKFDSNGNFLIKWGSGGAGNGDGEFSTPFGVTVGSDGSIYVTDSGNSRIQKFDSDGNFVTKWGSVGNEDGQFDGASGIAVGPDGFVYVAEIYNNRIQKFDSNGNFISKWVSFGIEQHFNGPLGIAVGPDGSVYVADTNNNRIEKFDGNGNLITQWEISGGMCGEVDCPPTGITVGPDGAVYVADSSNSRIQKFDTNGTFLTSWEFNGTPCNESCPPAGIAVGPDGFIYVAAGITELQLTGTSMGETAPADYQIQKFDSSGNFIAGWGIYGSGDGQFINPGGIAVAPDGSIYVADTGNHRIQRTITVTSEYITETLFETTLPINQPASATQDYTTNIGTLGATGKLQLQAILKNNLGQTIAQASYPFYIVDGNTALSFNSDKNIYQPGETVTITGQVENRATIEAVGLVIALSSQLRTQNSVLFTETFNIPASGTHPFAITTTAGADGLVTLTGEVTQDNSTLVKITDQYEVAKSDISVAVTMPEVIGSEPFNISVEMKNTGKVNGTVQFGVQSHEFGDSQTITIPPGEIKLLQYSQQISKDTSYTFTLTGDLEQTLQQVVRFGERADVQVTLPTSYREGDILIPYQLRNIGELQAAYSITFTLFSNGQELSRTTRTFTLPVNGTISDSLSYNLGKGSYVLRYETSGFQAESQVNVEKTAQGEITMAVNDFYPEGEILLPYTVRNVGGFDAEFAFEIELGTSLVSKTASIPAGEEYSGDLRFNLPSGNYTIKATLASQLSNPFSKSFHVVRENNVQMAAALGNQANGLVPVNANLTNLGFNEFSGSLSLGVTTGSGQTVWSGEQALSQLSPQSSQLLTLNINPSAIEAGNYTAQVTLLNNSNQPISTQTLTLEVQGATFQITQLPPYQTFSAGEEAAFAFTVKNTGNQEGSFDLTFKAYDLIDSTRREWLKPNEEKAITFGFIMPEDLEEKDYFADYELKASVIAGQSKGQIKYHLAGISLNVNASLDKPYYTEGETAHLTINIQSPNSNPQNLFARVNYAGYEPEQTFTLSGTQVLIFDIPLPKITGEKLFYGIYHEAGRSIHLNSVYIHKAGDVITITTDKQVYNPGETVSVSVTGSAAGDMTLSAPGGYTETFIFTGSATRSFTLPATVAAGTYSINAQLSIPDSELVTVVYPFDVAGIQVKVLECQNDKGKYVSSDNIATSFTISSNTSMATILKAWIVDPTGQYASVGEQNITLSSSESSLITHNSPLTTSVSGIHRLVYGIYGPEGLLLCSGGEAFDVGDAVLLGISAEKVDYPQGNESVVLKAGLYGSVTANLEFFLDGQSAGSQLVSLNGFSTLDAILPSVTPGPHTLKAVLTTGGLTSTKETTFTYGSGLSDLTLRLSRDQVIGQSSLNVSMTAVNQGKSPSGATTLHLYNGEISEGELLSTFDIPTLSQGQSQTLTFELNLLGKVGANTLSGIIDPSNTVYEFNESNNRDQIYFTVPEVTLSTTLEKDAYFAGETVLLTSFITNLSKDPLADFVLSTEVKDQAKVQVFSTTQNIPRIEAMTTISLLTSWSPDPNLAEGIYTIHQGIVGKDIYTQKSLTLLPGEDFTITTDAVIKKIEVGEVAEYYLQLTPLKAFKGEVHLSLSGYPENSTAYFTPNPVMITDGQTQSILTVIPPDQAAAGSYSMKVNATGGKTSYELDLSLNLTDFEMALIPATQTLLQIDKASYTITLNPLNGFDHGVTVEVNDIPPGMRASLSTKEVVLPQSLTLSLETSKWLLPGEYRIPIVAKAKTATHTLTAILNVQRNPLNVPGIVTVPGLLNKPIIRTFGPNGGLLTEFQVVDGGLGVNISAGDVDGDGVDEVIATTGWKLMKPGHLGIFRRDGTQVAFMETEQGYVSDLTAALGDFDGDWAEEVVLGFYKSPLSDPLHGGGGVKVYKVMENRFIDTGLLLQPYQNEGYFGAPSLTVSDVDGDGVPELITAPGPDLRAPAKIKVFKIDTSAGVGQWRLGSQVMDFIVPFSVNGFGAHVAAGDLDGDGRAEILVGAGPDPRKKAEVVIVYHGESGYRFERFMAYQGLLFGVNVSATDVDGDGIPEILTGPGPDLRAKSKVRIFRKDGTLIKEFQAYPDNIRFGVKVSTGRIGE